MNIDGKKIALQIRNELKEMLESLSDRKPGITMILVGEDPASQVYVAMKVKACHEVGIVSQVIRLPAEIFEDDLLKEIDRLNHLHEVDGILVQTPLPSHISTVRVMEALDPNKDVDGFHPVNVGKLLIGRHDGLVSCTPMGVRELLIRSNIPIAGKHIVVAGRSNVVGKPLAALLMQKEEHANATVTIAHSRTEDFGAICRQADILITAMGSPQFIKADMVKEGAVVIDVGISRVDAPDHPRGYRLVGDVDFEQVEKKASHITPVPGGVGPMTVAMLLTNTWKSFCLREGVPV